jgi:hypothetical protein
VTAMAYSNQLAQAQLAAQQQQTAMMNPYQQTAAWIAGGGTNSNVVSVSTTNTAITGTSATGGNSYIYQSNSSTQGVPQQLLQGRMPAPREFNRFLNASDMLVKFIEFLGTQQVKQHEALQIPIDLFIAWLVVEAAKADGEEPDQKEQAKLEKLGVLLLTGPQPRCACGRFMARHHIIRHRG